VHQRPVSSLQHTLARPVRFSGVGLHKGAPAVMTVIPAPADSGIVFVRTDENPFAARIPAHVDLVTTTQLGTNLTNEAGVSIATVEHLMAALLALGIDNARVEIDGPEVPILDGSSDVFVQEFLSAGSVSQGAPRRVIEVLETVEVTDGSKTVRLEPAAAFEVDVTIAFDSAAIGTQRVVLAPTAAVFADEMGAARTFGFLHQVEAMHAAGLALGGSMDNAIVVDGDTVLNADGLRFADEFARHKALDAVGDLALAGAAIRGRYVGVQGGHAMNVALVKALFARPQAWRWSLEHAPQQLLAAAGI
jgi:UDP-3-O-[3-hydroxymyristoyl] N-acetylglucosamine deacetylase